MVNRKLRKDWIPKFKVLAERAEALGCRFVQMPAGHIGMFHPDGRRIMTMSATTSDKRAQHKRVSVLRRVLKEEFGE